MRNVCGNRTQVDRRVNGKVSWKNADKDEHHKAHTFLAIILSVEKTDEAAGGPEKGADPQRRPFSGNGFFVDDVVFDDAFKKKHYNNRCGETEEWRQQKREPGVLGFIPVNRREA